MTAILLVIVITLKYIPIEKCLHTFPGKMCKIQLMNKRQYYPCHIANGKLFLYGKWVAIFQIYGISKSASSIFQTRELHIHGIRYLHCGMQKILIYCPSLPPNICWSFNVIQANITQETDINAYNLCYDSMFTGEVLHPHWEYFRFETISWSLYQVIQAPHQNAYTNCKTHSLPLTRQYPIHNSKRSFYNCG